MTTERSDSSVYNDLAVPGIPADATAAFEEPWQARAFAVAVTVAKTSSIDWAEFQSRLANEIETDQRQATGDQTEQLYYERWLRALESLSIDQGLVSADELERRSREFQAGDRDASEFLEGTPETNHSR